MADGRNSALPSSGQSHPTVTSHTHTHHVSSIHYTALCAVSDYRITKHIPKYGLELIHVCVCALCPLCLPLVEHRPYLSSRIVCQKAIKPMHQQPKEKRRRARTIYMHLSLNDHIMANVDFGIACDTWTKSARLVHAMRSFVGEERI